MSRTLSIIGIVLTLLYLGGVAWFFEGRLHSILGLTPNNFGDFLAGIFGPLAILWLILGFFQQGIELRQNTQALELQAKELQNSVEQQKQLVDVSRKQVEAELEVIHFERERLREAARPKFIFHGTGAIFSGPVATYMSSIKNLGAVVTDVSLSFSPEMKSFTPKKVYSWSPGEQQKLEWEYESSPPEADAFLTVAYVDAQGLPGAQTFKFSPVARAGERTMVEITKAD